MSGYDSSAQSTTAQPFPDVGWQPPAYGTDQTPPAKGAPRWLRWGVPTGALVFGLAVGVSLGVTVFAADPTRSEEYTSLQSDHEATLDDLSAARGEIAGAQDAMLDAQADASEAAAAASEAADAAEARNAELDERQAALVEREKAVTAVENQIAATSIGEGIWTVGVDVEPGTYRTAEALTGYCYWAILRSGTNGSDIVENDGPEGGFPTVTLSAGQDFENSGCGTFVKQ